MRHGLCIRAMLFKAKGEKMENYLWLVYALLSAVAAAMVSVFGKIGLQGLDAHTATAVRAVIMAAFLVAVAVFQRRWEHLPELWADKRAMTFILLSGVAGALSWLFYFTALKYGKVSQVASVDKLSVVLAATAAVVFLHETVSVMSAAGIGLITAGIILVALG